MKQIIERIFFCLCFVQLFNYNVATVRRQLQPIKDEFNVTESHVDILIVNETHQNTQHQKSHHNHHHNYNSDHSEIVFKSRQLDAIKRNLSRIDYDTCCPNWENLTLPSVTKSESWRGYNQVDELTLKPMDLLEEFGKVFENLTQLSIEGQQGDFERDRYYNFYDSVEYYLKLLKIFEKLIEDSGSSSRIERENLEFLTRLKRQLRTIKFKISRDPTLSSFLDELLWTRATINSTSVNLENKQNSTKSSTIGTLNKNFKFYEDFLIKTQFGHYYAANVSMIRESIVVFDQIYLHLTSTYFPSNFTKPSKQYEIIHKLSSEIYLIRRELFENINIRILMNRKDIRNLLIKLNRLETSRPYVKLLGDKYSTIPYKFGEHVEKFTNILDLYLMNNLTRVSFYEQLGELPEDFIVLGANIANDFELRELPQPSRLFDMAGDYYNLAYKPLQEMGAHQNQTNSREPAEKRQSNLSLLRRLFS